MKHWLSAMLFVAATATAGSAQEVFTTTSPATASKITAKIIASSSTKVVKNAPFSAEGISESVQVLPDGNRITRSSTTKMHRDSEGRFRREGTGNTNVSGAFGVGGFSPAFGFEETVSIYDPVAGVRIMLSPSNKTARRFNNQSVFTEGAVVVNGQTLSPSVKVQLEAAASQKANVIVMPNVMTGKISGGNTEQLGTKNIDGVQAEGTRSVTILGAGSVGNEKPIEIVYERWYSKELDLIVQSRHYDPRSGEQTYRLVNLSRNEPDRSLFTVPADYKIAAENPLKIFTTKQ